MRERESEMYRVSGGNSAADKERKLIAARLRNSFTVLGYYYQRIIMLNTIVFSTVVVGCFNFSNDAIIAE